MLALLALIAAVVCFVLAVLGLGTLEWVALGLLFVTLALILGNPVVSQKVQ